MDNMVKHFITADVHFHHRNIIKYTNRWKVVLTEAEREKYLANELRLTNEHTHRMDEMLMGNINKTVGEDDVLHILGDLAHGLSAREYSESVYRILDRIKCRTIRFVIGNHDRGRIILREFGDNCFVRPFLAIDKKTGEFFMDDFGEAHGKFREDRNAYHAFVLNHYFQGIWQDSHRGVLHAYGHSHHNAEVALDRLMPERRCMDVGVDTAFEVLGEHRPFSLDEIVGRLGPRKGFLLDHHGEDREKQEKKS